MPGPGQSLVVLAGRHALARIRRDGFSADTAGFMGAAAGGPKWLILNRLDRALFGEWFRGRTRPLAAIGASIGSWRLACAAQQDPVAAIERFEAAYLGQQYGPRPTPAEVSAEARRILDVMLGETGAQEILAHPWLKLNVVTALCRGGIGSRNGFLQKTALAGAALSNLLSRRLLALWMQRLVLHPAGAAPPAFHDGFRTRHATLDAGNLADALMASAAIPMVMAPVRDIAGAPAGACLDGGMIDYHMDLPLRSGMDLPLRSGMDLPFRSGMDLPLRSDMDSSREDHAASRHAGDIVFLPHFGSTVTPGWLDKFLPWRRARHLDDVLLVAPSPALMAALPNGKVPDRRDFQRYAGRDAERIRDWKIAVAEGQRLADDFMELAASGRIAEHARPFAAARPG
jgi:hypothetical protein